MTDWQLLQKFTDSGSQAAFSELSRRYTNLVYCVCQRELGNPTLAEDAAQAVFLVLARRAPALRPSRAEATLSSWLFQTALLTSKNVHRQEQRRQAREQEAAQMQQEQSYDRPDWAEIEPLLNDALHALPLGQRSLILERFVQERPLAEIGAGLGVSEDAARMRVNRALERLRRFFAARNTTLSATALAALLPLAVRPAPTHAAELIARLQPASGGTPASTLAQGVLHIMNLNRLRLQLGAATLIAVFVLGTAGAVHVTTQMKAKAVQAEQQQSQTQALAIMNQMYATYAAMKSFKCHDIIHQDNLGATSDTEYEIERPNKVWFDRVSLFDPGRQVQAGSVDLSGRTSAVSDDKNIYVTFALNHKQANEFVEIPLADALTNSYNLGDWGGVPGNGGEAFAGMPSVIVGLRLRPLANQNAPEYSLGASAAITFPGSTHPIMLNVVTAKMKYNTPQISKFPGAGETVTYYIGQQDHLLYQVIAMDYLTATNYNTMTETISNMEIGPNLPASDFVFTPPPGSHEVPNTSDLFPSGRR